MTKFLLIFWIAISLASFGRSQARTITVQEFSGIYYEALAKSQERSRRQRSKLENFVDGRVTKSADWVFEYLMPYSRRVVYREMVPKKFIEEINVGEDTFCREGKAIWRRSVSTCLSGEATRSQSAFQVSGKMSGDYFSEESELEGRRLRKFREVLVYKNQSLKNRGQTWTAENAFWLDTDGSLVRQEIRMGRSGDKVPSSIWLDIYEYEPSDLKIEVPVK